MTKRKKPLDNHSKTNLKHTRKELESMAISQARQLAKQLRRRKICEQDVVTKQADCPVMSAEGPPDLAFDEPEVLAEPVGRGSALTPDVAQALEVEAVKTLVDTMRSSDEKESSVAAGRILTHLRAVMGAHSKPGTTSVTDAIKQQINIIDAEITDPAEAARQLIEYARTRTDCHNKQVV